MLFKLEILIVLCIFVPKLIAADSYVTLTNLGKSVYNHNSSDDEFSNCSEYNIAYGSSCTCFDCDGGRCTICCNSPGFTCCYCHACLTTCWKNDWQLISLTQVGLSTALLLATIGTIALLFRICNGGLMLSRRTNSTNSLIRHSTGRVSVSSMQQYVIERLQDRPPRYNDVSDAPPVYDVDPANREATQEAPPAYTRRPQAAESTNNSGSTPESNSVQSSTTSAQSVAATHHM